MKIKTKKLSYDKVMALPRERHKDPLRPSIFWRTLIRGISQLDLWATGFKYTFENREKAGEGPYFILMNHSSFIDLEIAYGIFYPKPLSIICTSDGFVGKPSLMRWIGCIPTQKFVTDLTLIKDIRTALKKGSSILMYPEASYTFDGRATPLPRGMGSIIKRLGVPVVTVITSGAFLRDPLYNCLQKRKVKVSAKVECILDTEEIKSLSVDEIDALIDEKFSFDGFAEQKEKGIVVDEPFRADGLERILYKCANCGVEGATKGEGVELHCSACGKSYELTELGELAAKDGKTEFPHIPDWYGWERECVRRELEAGEYRLECDVDIGVMVDYKAIYMVGQGHLSHTQDGFVLHGCDGKLHYEQSPLSSYGLYSDYYWYEIGDVICIGNRDALYYCFPKKEGVVAKTRLAAEELYKIKKAERKALSDKRKSEKVEQGV